MENFMNTKKADSYCPNMVRIFLLLLSIIFIGACKMDTSPSVPKSVAEINANPEKLNNLHVKDCELSELIIKNTHIKNLTLENIDAFENNIENVTFENCSFIRVQFYRSTFSNVAFKNCRIVHRGTGSDHKDRSEFSEIIFRNVLFDNTILKRVDFGTMNGDNGFILFKNMQQIVTEEHSTFMNVENAHVRVLNSTIHGVIAGDPDMPSTSITKNSKYIDGGIYCDQNFILHSTMQDSYQIGAFKTLVITDSILDGSVRVHNGNGYLSNNTYVSRTRELFFGGTMIFGPGILAKKNGNVYMMAKDNTPTALRIFGGNVTVKDFTLVNTLIGTTLEKEPDIGSLNLQNVIVRGGEWEGKILGGKWENVRIEPSVVTNETYIRNIQAHRLEYPKGYPWQKRKKERAFVLEVKESNTPFDWPEIHVPTYEELGLVWWPEVEPGYHGGQ
jgi:hypothetical protein